MSAVSSVQGIQEVGHRSSPIITTPSMGGESVITRRVGVGRVSPVAVGLEMEAVGAKLAPSAHRPEGDRDVRLRRTVPRRVSRVRGGCSSRSLGA